MKNKYYPHLASPITINNLTFKNRILGAPMSNPELDSDCNMRKEEIAFHENRARGGLAGVAIGLGIVDAIGRSHTKEVKLYDVMSLPSLKEAANAMHRQDVYKRQFLLLVRTMIPASSGRMGLSISFSLFFSSAFNFPENPGTALRAVTTKYLPEKFRSQVTQGSFPLMGSLHTCTRSSSPGFSFPFFFRLV